MEKLMIPNEDLVDEDSIEGLKKFLQDCKGKDSEQYLNDETHIQDIYLFLMNALKAADANLLQKAIIALGQYLHNKSLIALFPIRDRSLIVASSKQRQILIDTQVKPILRAFSKAVDGSRFSSSSVEFEVLRAVSTFLSRMPQPVLSQCEIWWQQCLVSTVHQASRVREIALSILNDYKQLIFQNSHVQKTFSVDIKSTIVPGMLKLFMKRGEMYVLKLWKSIVNFSGKLLHIGSSLINSLLEVVDKAFKMTSQDIRLAAYECWYELINNFAIDPDVIGNIKRLRLVLQPLRNNTSSSEEVVKARLDVWWHLVDCLGLDNPQHFELVFEPLVKLCFGLNEFAGSNGCSSNAGRVNSITTVNTSNCFLFKKYQSLLVGFGMQVLARFFEACHGPVVKVATSTLSLKPLKQAINLKPAVFLNHSQGLLQAMKVATSLILPGKDNQTLVVNIWMHFATELKISIADSEKSEMQDAVSMFFCTIESVMKTETVDFKTALGILDLAATLPTNILSSSSFIIGSSNSLTGTPGFLLLDLLLSTKILEKCGYNTKFITLFNRLTAMSPTRSSPTVLHSFWLTIQLLIKAIPIIEKEDLIGKLWLALASHLMEFVEANQEVNQGDSFEHDFTCMHAVLIFPFQTFIWKLNNVPLKRNILKKWENLYALFARCAAIVDGVEENTCCVELATKLRTAFPENMKIEEVEDVIHALDALINSVRWSVLKKVEASENPRELKWPRNKNTKTFELAPVTQLIASTINSVINCADKLTILSTQLCNTLLGYIEILLENLKQENFVSVLWQFLPQLVEIIRLSSIASSVFAQPIVSEKIECVWNKLTKNLQLNYTGPYDTDFLNAFSPLLEVTLCHKRRNIYMNARLFWQATFASSYNEHLIPNSLREVMENIKPMIGIENSSLDDVTNFSSGESKMEPYKQANLSIPGSGLSLPKVTGSLLNKSSTPMKRLSMSPVVNYTTPKSKAIEDMNSKKRLSMSPVVNSTTPKSKAIEDMNSKDFTVINTSPRTNRRRILTEHQKEVASKRALLPAMYVDLSQDSCAIPIETQTIEDSQQLCEMREESALKSCPPSLNKENVSTILESAAEPFNANKKTSAEASNSPMKEQKSASQESPAKSRSRKGDIAKPALESVAKLSQDSPEKRPSMEVEPDKSDSTVTEFVDKIPNSLSCFPADAPEALNSPGKYLKNKIDFLSNFLLLSKPQEAKIENGDAKTRRRSARKSFPRQLNYNFKRKYGESKAKKVVSASEGPCPNLEESGEEKVEETNENPALNAGETGTQNGAKTSERPDLNSAESLSEKIIRVCKETFLNSSESRIEKIVKLSEVLDPNSEKSGPEMGAKTSIELLDEMGQKSSSLSAEEVAKIAETVNPDIASGVILVSSSSMEDQFVQEVVTEPQQLSGSSSIGNGDSSSESSQETKAPRNSIGLKKVRTKTHKITEEDVVKNIRARKRKFPGVPGVSPPLTRTRKKLKLNSGNENGKGSNVSTPLSGTPDTSEHHNCIGTDQQTLPESMPAFNSGSDNCKANDSTMPDRVTSPVLVSSEESSSDCLVVEERPVVSVHVSIVVESIEKSDSNTPEKVAESVFPSFADSNKIQNVNLVESPRNKLLSADQTDVKSSPAASSSDTTPIMSPSGILRKRKTVSGVLMSTPPNKRKVSFADPPVQDSSPSTPNTGRTMRMVNRRLLMTKNSPQMRLVPNGKNQVSQDQRILEDFAKDSHKGPLITELNCVNPICPELADSKEPIDILIPHLTTSLHGRGLSKLLASRSVTTVGHLSSMTEADIHTLPIQSPKLSVVHKALSKAMPVLKAVVDDDSSPVKSPVNTDPIPATEITVETIASDSAKNNPKAVELELPCLEDEFSDISFVVEEVPDSDPQPIVSDEGEQAMEQIASDIQDGDHYQRLCQLCENVATCVEQLPSTSLCHIPENKVMEFHTKLLKISTTFAEKWMASKLKSWDANK